MSLYGITTPTANDPWVVRQFQGFDGFPDTIAPGNGGSVLIPGIPPSPVQNPLTIANPDSSPFYAVNPMGSGNRVFGYEGQGVAWGSEQEKPMPETGVMVVNGGGQGTGGEIGPAVLPQLQPMPSMTTATMPTVTGTANTVLGTNGQVGHGPAAITPEWLNQRLPSIVNPAPVDMGIPGCGSGVSGFVGDHPVVAVVGLLALAWMVWGKK